MLLGKMKHLLQKGLIYGKIFLKDSLFNNSIYLISSTIATAFLGFIFWIVAARYYSAEEVGFGSTIVSLMMFLSYLTLLGFNISIIRYLPKANRKSDLINTTFTLIFIAGLAVTTVALLTIELWSPKLLFLRENIHYSIAFVIFTTVWALTIQMTSVFVAQRSSRFVLIKESVFGTVRIPIMIALAASGSLGIFLGWGIGALIGFLLGLTILIKYLPDYSPYITIKRNILQDSFNFSFWNYIATIFNAMPGTLLPVIITNILYAEMAAYFYMAWMIANILYAVPIQVSQSLFAEGANTPEMMRQNLKKATIFIYIIIIPAILFIFILGDFLLSLFGRQYAENGFLVLQLLSVAAIPYAMNLIFFSIERIRGRAKNVTFCYAVLALTTVLISGVLMKSIGLSGVGLAWIVGNAIVLLIISVISRKEITKIIQNHSKSGGSS